MSCFGTLFFDFLSKGKSFYFTNGQEKIFNNKLYLSSYICVTKMSEGLGFAGISMDILCSKDNSIIMYLESIQDISQVSIIVSKYDNTLIFRGNLFYMNVNEDNGYLIFSSSLFCLGA